MTSTRTVIALCVAAAFAASCGPDPDTSTCGPETCFSGCCQNGECIEAQSTAACGNHGTACDVCGAAQICTTGQCTEAATWAIRPISAVISRNDPRDQLSWDVDDSAPDVVVTMGCPLRDGGVTWSSTEEVQSYAPSFAYGGCRASRQDIIDRGVEVEVSDVDFLVDDPIDSFRLNVPPTAFPTLSVLDTAQRDGGLVSLTISIGNPQ